MRSRLALAAPAIALALAACGPSTPGGFPGARAITAPRRP